MKVLRDRVVLVTGASSGIGYHTALEFAREGCRVAVCARREDRLADLAKKIESSGGQCFPLTIDVADRNAIASMVDAVVKRWDRLDIAVANAGYGCLARVEDIEKEEMERIWNVNFLGTLWTVQAAVPPMKAQGEGHIVMVSSVVGRYSIPLSGAYCVTKFSQTALGQALRPELRNHNIGVTMVYPGYTATEFGEKQLHHERRRQVLRKAQTPAEVARRIVSGVRRNKKEIYPSFTGSLFAHLGLWFPWLADELVTRMLRGMEN